MVAYGGVYRAPGRRHAEEEEEKKRREAEETRQRQVGLVRWAPFIA